MIAVSENKTWSGRNKYSSEGCGVQKKVFRQGGKERTLDRNHEEENER